MRDGREDACGAIAIGMRFDLEVVGPWPVCARHAHPARYLGNGRWSRS